MADGARFTYSPGHGLGHGERHAGPADPPLHERPAFPGAPADWPPAARTMADLDLKPGTVVTVRVHEPPADEPGWTDPGTDHRGLVVAEWDDQHGNPRATSFEPGYFAEHFTEVTG